LGLRKSEHTKRANGIIIINDVLVLAEILVLEEYLLCQLVLWYLVIIVTKEGKETHRIRSWLARTVPKFVIAVYPVHLPERDLAAEYNRSGEV